MGKVLAVYYSRTGKTEKVVQQISELTNCNVERLVDNKNRKGILGYIFGGRDALAKKLTSIQAIKYNPSQYDTVIICTPTWGSTMAPAVRTYINNNKEKLKEVAFLVTAGGESNGKIYSDLEEVAGKSPKVKVALSGKDLKTDSWKGKIQSFINVIIK